MSATETGSISTTSPTGAAPADVHKTAGAAGKRRSFKVIVLGESGVGKTCLSFRFCSGHFPGDTEATIGVDFREKILRVDNEEIRLQVWDTAGQERFRRSMVPHYYRNVSAVVFVYDVTRRSSFESLSHWMDECARHGVSDTARVPMLVVGNKCDDTNVTVSTNEAQRFSDDHGMPLFETSAKDDSKADHVEAIFLTLAHKIKHSRPLIRSGSLSSTDSSPSRRIGHDGQQQQPAACCFFS